MNVCIVGSGYVGLVTAACFSEMGNQVVCVDANPEIIEGLKSGKIHIYEPGLEDLVGRNVAEERLGFSTDLREGLENALYIFNCVGTDNVRTSKLLESLYAPFTRSRDKMMVMDIRSAEMTKYAANCMLATKISFINEIANICEKLGANVGAVRLGIGADHRIGHHFIYPGAGYGGSCFPKDVKALIESARENGYEPELIAAVDSVNHRQKRLLAEKILAHFQDHGGPAGRCLALWGLAFKGNTDDIREASSLAVIAAICEAGISVRAYDPAAVRNARRMLEGNPMVSILEDQYQTLEGADGLAVVTDWNQFRNPDFNRIRALLKEPVIFDGRNLYSPDSMTHQGFTYYSIGRPPAGPPVPRDRKFAASERQGAAVCR